MDNGAVQSRAPFLHCHVMEGNSLKMCEGREIRIKTELNDWSHSFLLLREGLSTAHGYREANLGHNFEDLLFWMKQMPFSLPILKEKKRHLFTHTFVHVALKEDDTFTFTAAADSADDLGR